VQKFFGISSNANKSFVRLKKKHFAHYLKVNFADNLISQLK